MYELLASHDQAAAPASQGCTARLVCLTAKARWVVRRRPHAPSPMRQDAPACSPVGVHALEEAQLIAACLRHGDPLVDVGLATVHHSHPAVLQAQALAQQDLPEHQAASTGSTEHEQGADKTSAVVTVLIQATLHVQVHLLWWHHALANMHQLQHMAALVAIALMATCRTRPQHWAAACCSPAVCAPVHNVHLGEHTNGAVTSGVHLARNAQRVAGRQICIGRRDGQDDGIVTLHGKRPGKQHTRLHGSWTHGKDYGAASTACHLHSTNLSVLLMFACGTGSCSHAGQGPCCNVIMLTSAGVPAAASPAAGTARRAASAVSMLELQCAAAGSDLDVLPAHLLQILHNA